MPHKRYWSILGHSEWERLQRLWFILRS